MKRKFSLDIPRLKMGPSKADVQAFKGHLALGLGLPLEEPPKSVRPPLPPEIETELRRACGHILENFKPSHIAYEEQLAGSGPKPQLDYAAIKGLVQREMEESFSPLSKLNTNVSTGEFELPKQEAITSERFKYMPNTDTKDLFEKEKQETLRALRQAQIRADKLMAAEAPKAPPATGRERSLSEHKRSHSTPLRTSSAAPKVELLERPRTAMRKESTDTTGSTPQTDTNDYPWSADVVSTAPTTAAVTPARSSKRTSSLVLQPGLEASSVPKVAALDAERMRQALEKHKKAQEEGAADVRLPASIAVPASKVPTPFAQVPARKPVPISQPESRQGRSHVRTDDRQSKNSPQVESTQTYQPTRSDSRQAQEAPGSDSRQTRETSRPPIGVRTISRRVEEYFRPGSAQGTLKSEDARRSHSRSRSVSRQVKEYFRPLTAASTSRSSVEVSRHLARSESQDSLRSTVSKDAPSPDTSTNKWRTWRPHHLSNRSFSSQNGGRPGTSDSSSRGRPTTRAASVASSLKTKPPVNLNRELPPLPGLDQWKPEELEKPKRIAALATPSPKSPGGHSVDSAKTAKAVRRPQPITIGSSPSAKDDIVVARMSSIKSEKAATRHPTQPSRAAPAAPKRPQPSDPPPEPPAITTTTTNLRASEKYYLVPRPTKGDSPHINMDVTKERQRSKTIQSPYSSGLAERFRSHASSPIPSTETAASAKVAKAQLIISSRGAASPRNSDLNRTVSKKSLLATAPNNRTAATTSANMPLDHSRNNSDHTNFSRTFSMYEDNRLNADSQYQNLAELSKSPTISSTYSARGKKSTALTPQSKEKSKRHWWQASSKDQDKEKQTTWIDHVIKPGARAAPLLSDDAAGSPVIRY